jgi:hypothetical protein
MQQNTGTNQAPTYNNFQSWLSHIDWRLYAFGIFGVTFIFLYVPMFFLGIASNVYVAGAIGLASLLVTLLFFRRVRYALERIDWRVGYILVATGLAASATVVVYVLGYGRDPVTFFGAIFAGWVGGIALFIFVGVVVAVVSLARPEQEPFESRARILFRRQGGKHIDYIIARVRQIFEHYAESVENLYIIKDYEVAEKKFLINWIGKGQVRSYIDDITSSYSTSISLRHVSLPPQGKPSNKLNFLRVGVTPYGGTDFADTIEKHFETSIEKGGSCAIEYSIEFWATAQSEPNTYSPQRYTQSVILRFENQLLLDKAVHLYLVDSGGKTVEETHLRPGETKTFSVFKDVEPNVRVYDFRISPLT